MVTFLPLGLGRSFAGSFLFKHGWNLCFFGCCTLLPKTGERILSGSPSLCVVDGFEGFIVPESIVSVIVLEEFFLGTLQRTKEGGIVAGEKTIAHGLVLFDFVVFRCLRDQFILEMVVGLFHEFSSMFCFEEFLLEGTLLQIFEFLVGDVDGFPGEGFQHSSIHDVCGLEVHIFYHIRYLFYLNFMKEYLVG